MATGNHTISRGEIKGPTLPSGSRKHGNGVQRSPPQTRKVPFFLSFLTGVANIESRRFLHLDSTFLIFNLDLSTEINNKHI